MKIAPFLTLFSIAALASADGIPPCPSTVTSCTFTVSPAGGPGFALPGTAWVTTATPGELIVTAGYNPNAGGDLFLNGMLIGGATTVPEPQTAWLIVAGVVLMAIVRSKSWAKIPANKKG